MTRLPVPDQYHVTAEAVCSRCGQPYPLQGFPHRCPSCGGVYTLAHPTVRQGAGIDLRRSLGEGATPLLQLEDGVFAKCEQANPTGSYKDRGTARLIDAIAGQEIADVVEDSSGNAGASLAGYAARAGIRARIFTPASASGPKRAQILRYGAELIEVQGSRSRVTQAVLEEVKQGTVYASHAYQPHWLMGVAGMAVEMASQIHPGSVTVPVGQGGLLEGLYHGFRAAMEAGMLETLPVIYGVQTEACSPIWHRYTEKAFPEVWGESLAKGICVAEPARWEGVLRVISETGGSILTVDEPAIQQAVDALAQMGLDVEPTAAVSYAAVCGMAGVAEPAVLILTGAGWKHA